MDKLRILQKVCGKYIAVLARDLRVDGSNVVEASNMSELHEKLLRATHSDGWKTINGAHVLLDKNNYIVAGAGGKFTGMKFGFKFHKPIIVRGKKSFGLYGTHKIQKMRVAKKSNKVKTVAGIAPALKKLGIKDIGSNVFEGMDPKVALANANQLIALEKKFGIIKQADVAIERERYSVASVGRASKNPLLMRLRFNTDDFKSEQEVIASVEKYTQNGWWSKSSKENYLHRSVTHEYGHMLQNTLYAKRMREMGWTPENPNALLDNDGFAFYAARGDYRRAHKALGAPYDKVAKDVAAECRSEILAIARKRNRKFKKGDFTSRYGLKNDMEFFAEAFANSQLGEPNELGDAMNIWLKQKGLC